MSGEWTVVIRGDWYLPHLVNMLQQYRGSGEQTECRDEVVAQIESQMIGAGLDKTTRPVVVIDPEDREQVERLLATYYRSDGPQPLTATDVIEMQAALRSLLAPPRPPEPQGLGAVVEDAEGVRWVRSHITHPGPWTKPGVSGTWTYPAITAVRVLSEGVTE